MTFQGEQLIFFAYKEDLGHNECNKKFLNEKLQYVHFENETNGLFDLDQSVPTFREYKDLPSIMNNSEYHGLFANCLNWAFCEESTFFL